MPITYRVGLIGCGRMGATIDDEVKGGPNAQLFPAVFARRGHRRLRAHGTGRCLRPNRGEGERIRDRYSAQRAYADYRK